MGYLDDRAGLAGKVAVVIGGGAGLGRATVDDLARSNVRVVVCDNDGDALTATSARSELEGTTVVTVEGDGRDPAVLDSVFERVDEAFGRLDVLVNVVGGTFHQAFGVSNPRGWDALIRTNFTWLLSATQLAIPRMRAAGGGSIVNFTSIEGHRATPNFAVSRGDEGSRHEFQSHRGGGARTRWYSCQLRCCGSCSDRGPHGYQRFVPRTSGESGASLYPTRAHRYLR